MSPTLLALFLVTHAAAQTVCVTGAGGYVATELVKQLLENGFHVKGTVRDTTAMQYKHLNKIDTALPGKLQLMAADLLNESSFDECADGSKYVFHTASPFHFDARNTLEDMVKPARDGTENVLKSAIKAKVERVIVTSSFAASASFLPDDKPDDGELYSEEDWNDFIDESIWKDNKQQAYIASKSIAERKAWEMGKAHGIDVVVIQPSLVMGPVHAPRVEGVSVGTMKSLIEGSPLPFAFPWCDNRDVARAHIQAAINPKASGRYIISSKNTVPHSYVYDVLSKNFPTVAWAKPGKEESPTPMVNNKKIMSLLGGLYPLEDTILDMARSLMASGLAQPKKQVEL